MPWSLQSRLWGWLFCDTKAVTLVKRTCTKEESCLLIQAQTPVTTPWYFLYCSLIFCALETTIPCLGLRDLSSRGRMWILQQLPWDSIDDCIKDPSHLCISLYQVSRILDALSHHQSRPADEPVTLKCGWNNVQARECHQGQTVQEYDCCGLRPEQLYV